MGIAMRCFIVGNTFLRYKDKSIVVIMLILFMLLF